MQPAIGVIVMFGADFAPQGWSTCSGQLLAIAQNQALFSILGTTYGGNGQTTFGLPDFRGRTPMGGGMGQGPGLSNRSLGEKSGVESVTLLANNLPAHTHTGTLTVATTSNAANSDEVSGMIYATGGAAHFASGGGTGTLGGVTAALSNTGGQQPFSIRQPYLAVTFIIALVGIFPSRN